MLLRIHFFPGLCFLLLGLGILLLVYRQLVERYPELRRAIVLATTISIVLQMFGYVLEFHRVQQYFPVLWSTWLACAALVEEMFLIGLYFALLAWSQAPKFQAPRRAFLQAAGAGLCIAPIAGTAF